MAVWYMIDGDVCKFANQQYGADYQEGTAGSRVASGKTIQFVGGTFKLPANATNMFCNMANTTFDASKVDTSQCTNMNGLFSSCRGITSLDLSNFDTSKVTDMQNMFDGDTNLESINVSSFNTASVVNFTDMFNGCSNLKSVNVSGFNTSNANYFGSMFCGCESLTRLNLHNFNVNKGTHMNDMFLGCSNLEYLDLYNFNVVRTSVTQYITIRDMFNGCSNLRRIEVRSGQDGNLQEIDSTNMFSGCTKLPNWDGTVDKTRANNTTSYGYFGVYGYGMYDYDVGQKDSEGGQKKDLYLKDNNTGRAQIITLK